MPPLAVPVRYAVRILQQVRRPGGSPVQWDDRPRQSARRPPKMTIVAVGLEQPFLNDGRGPRCGVSLTFDEILGWLRETSDQRLDWLWREADRVRREQVGDDVHLRGLLEISNYCDRQCLYCGIRQPNVHLERYRMTADEILAGAREAIRCGYGTIVMQAGEDPALDVDELCAVIRAIKQDTPLAVTLSLGERSEAELRSLRRAGADRYLLRFETSNLDLLHALHPPRAAEPKEQRLSLLGRLGELGFEVGSGVMVGLPGQSLADLARDILLFRQLDLDMIGIGPYIPHPHTPLFERGSAIGAGCEDQAAADELTTYKMIALTRLACPQVNIPSTTALATISPQAGRILGLARGANIVMPNLTPLRYRSHYEIYPNKAGARGTPEESDRFVREQIRALGRRVGTGRGDSIHKLAKRQAAIRPGAE
jgi:biotin synthase